MKSKIKMSVILSKILKKSLQNSYRRYFSHTSVYSNKKNYLEEINKLILSLGEYREKIIYNSYIETQFKWKVAKQMKKEHVNYVDKLDTLGKIPIALKYMENDGSVSFEEEICEDSHVETENEVKIPYGRESKLLTKVHAEERFNIKEDTCNVEEEVKMRYNMQNNDSNWMLDYEKYNDEDMANVNFYGTEDPRSPISCIPCGGCGAYLHCRDSSLPGYIPSEIYKNYNLAKSMELKSLICQRCHFLKNYNLALQLRVSSDDYPKVLSTIKNYKQALVVLMVDLLDFPCSIWPGITDLIGYNRPILIVGNKVDLLQVDDKNFLKRIENRLLMSMKECGFATTNIKGVSLISAKTGFGVENLINNLHAIWKYNGDVFLVGCTNVGKSSLFNILLQSDYCKSQAADLIQRATTSPWPGTTLNLLKFPILRPSSSRLQSRAQRLMNANKLINVENKFRQENLKSTKKRKFATLIGYVDRTFPTKAKPENDDDGFSVKLQKNPTSQIAIGIDEKDPEYALSKWCYDTPGVVHPDQITDLLTTEELVKLFPKEVIKPRTYRVRVGQSLFIAGLSRLDYLEGTYNIYFTVFCGNQLPITLCETDVADVIYEKLVGTELFGLPMGKERLKLWPNLKSGKTIYCTGINFKESCIDVVLSSSGWIAITCAANEKCVLQGWTPDARGIHVRDSLLPKAVNFRGNPVRKTPTYTNNKFYRNTALV